MVHITVKQSSNVRRTPDKSTYANIAFVTETPLTAEAEPIGDWYKFTLELYAHKDVAAVMPVPPNVVTDIPYRSQWDLDANKRSSDCGQTCVAMLADSRGIDVSINDLRFQSTTRGETTAEDLIKNFASIGLKADKVMLIKPYMPPAVGSICLVKYSGFNRASVQDKGFLGWHWVVYLAETADYVVVHDPNFSGTRRNEGALKLYTMQEWRKAFVSYGGTALTSVVLKGVI